jgi:hypothetical protein
MADVNKISRIVLSATKPPTYMIYNAENFEDQTLYPRISFHVNTTDCGGQQIISQVGFLTAVSTKMDVFWVVAPCSLVEVYRRFRGACCLHHQGMQSKREDEQNILLETCHDILLQNTYALTIYNHISISFETM